MTEQTEMTDISIFESEKALTLLREIESNINLTQRYLSQKYGISLGKTNYLIKSFLSRGLIKVQRFKNSKNRIGYMYVVTPEGIRHRAAMARRFLEIKTKEYDELKQIIQDLEREVAQNP